MNKDAIEAIWAIIILVAVFFAGCGLGGAGKYDKGLSEGIAISKGDKWDCAYSYATGFLMCDRTPKYKD